jgi:pyruvate,water dikinase
MQTEFIFNLKDKSIPETIGAKAQNLRFLVQKKFSIPETYVCTWDAYLSSFSKGKNPVHDLIKAELSQKLDLSKHYAIRSSANIEDGTSFSCAGQFKTILNVTGIDNIISAIETIWSSANSDSVKTYLRRVGEDSVALRMAVIIQEMVEPAISGVTFSRNPMTGMDEIIVEATVGKGENIIQNGTDPERWINKWGEWTVKPDNSTIGTALIQDVVSDTKKIAEIYGADVDVEWVYDGNNINWVQLREITSLKNTTFYANHLSREVFPGMIKPLIWSINVPLVCSAWIRLFEELVGKVDFNPLSLAKSFYYRAYFNMGTIGKILEALGLPNDTLELLLEVESHGTEKPSFKPGLKTLLLLPKILIFAFDKIRFSRKLKQFLPDMKHRYSSFSPGSAGKLTPAEIISEIEKLYKLNEETAYYMIITYCLMGIYNGLLKYQVTKYGIEFDTIDLTHQMDEFNQFNPMVSLSELSHTFKHLPQEVKKRVLNSSYKEFLAIPNIGSFKESVKKFIEHFGHLSDSGNDFSCKPWREDPETIITMIVNYTHRPDKPIHKDTFKNLTLPPLKRLLLKPLFQGARNFRYYREAIGFLYAFGYGMMRPYFLALDNVFFRKGHFANQDDIFFLSFNEIKALLKDETLLHDYRKRIFQRKQEMKDYEDLSLPHIIYGNQQPPVIRKTTKNILSGIPTSKGVWEGKVKVVHGISDFYKLEDGDVLVIPFSDVGLTPLFSKAGAIVAESGGFLSHSSIIAREYEIPAVVSVPGACSIEDNTSVTVDGFKGKILIHH